MVLAKAPQKVDPDLVRTPFVQQASGKWSLFLIENKEIEWGHRFDPGIGYRVYIKFMDSVMANVLFSIQARKLAVMVAKGEDDEERLKLAAAIKKMAGQVEKLNQAWAAAGMPDNALDNLETGNA